MVMDVNIKDMIKRLEQNDVLRLSPKLEDAAVTPKVVPAETSKTKKVVCNCSYSSNSATNWWLGLIAFLLFLMLCLNPNFE